ncbi:hypothetical protein ABEB36_014526 [Hypothenemus hampei]|uniref:HAT C-terminal dimerisation domain-containing protein n=1 Tax=Hypothenemus hampei TaxID=57062 RepID=A0ABD1E227_HYPHA
MSVNLCMKGQAGVRGGEYAGISWFNEANFQKWLLKSPTKSDEFAYCKVCKCDIKARKSILKQHEQSLKHNINMNQIDENAIGITYASKNLDLDKDVRIAELKLSAMLATNNLSLKLIDTLTPLLKNVFHDSRIAQNLWCHHEKAKQIVVKRLGDSFLDTLNNLLKKPGCFFSLIMDETTDISMKKQCGITVIYYNENKNKIITDFIDLIELEGGSAIHLYNALKFSIVSYIMLNHTCSRIFLPLSMIYIGTKAKQTLESMNNVNLFEKTQFFNTILNFYIELVNKIKEKFVFDDRIFELLNIVEPTFAQSFKVQTLTHVLEGFPILYQFLDDIEAVNNEWRQFVLLNYKDFDINCADKFWTEVFELRIVHGNTLFPNLKIIINFLMVLPFSNASVERVFSNLKNIKTDKTNLLQTNTIKGILATKKGISTNGGCVKFKPSQEMLMRPIWD